MKILIVSDSHGEGGRLARLLRLHSDAEAVFFLGDGLSDAEFVSGENSSVAWFAVRGNCDPIPIFRGCPVDKVGAVTLSGKRIVYTHGDLYGAKYGEGGLVALMQKENADILLYGHTHTPNLKYFDGHYLFNPGALSGFAPSYGLLTLDGDNVLFSHGTVI